MRRYSLHDHVAAEDYVIQADRNVTGTMPRQMDKLKLAESHVHGFVSEIHGNRLVDGFGKTINAQKLIARLFRETGVG
jgi:hypothetical protein